MRIFTFQLLMLVMGPFMNMHAQTNDPRTFIKKGNLAAQATIAPGYMPSLKSSPVYLHGDLEYYLEEKISVRGDSYFYLTSLDDEKPYLYNHSSFAGIMYHFTSEKAFDPYLGFQPGASFAKANVYTPLLATTDFIYDPASPAVSPLISIVVGFNFFANKYFHLQMGARYIYGEHNSKGLKPLSLQEIRFSFGLGWNLRIKKADTVLKNNEPMN